jgi:hypothetical protein
VGLLAYVIAPATRTPQDTVDVVPIVRWASEPKPCGAATPTPLAGRALSFETRYASAQRSLTAHGKTGSTGAVTIDPLWNDYEAVADQCGEGTLTVTSTDAPVAWPTEPTVAQRGHSIAAPLSLPVRGPGLGRPPNDAAARGLAASCQQARHASCLSAVRAADASGTLRACEESCAQSVDSLPCLRAARACLAMAQDDGDRAYCTKEAASCHAMNGVAAEDLTACAQRCVATQQEARCR